MMNLVLREIVARASVEAKQDTDWLVCARDDQPKLNKRVSMAKDISNNNIDDMASGSRLNGFYRPRSALARALYEKQHNDRFLQEQDQNELLPVNSPSAIIGISLCGFMPNTLLELATLWALSFKLVETGVQFLYRFQRNSKHRSFSKIWYRVNKDRLSPDLMSKFVQLYPDDETKQFLTSSIEKSSWVWTQCWYLIAKAVLRHFWSVTDINGWLGRGSMFVLSEAQARALLQPVGRSMGAGALVDVGAGDGEVSRRFAHLYPHNYATEISGSMRKALSNKGYKILDTDDWWRYRQFDCVCMLNLLDRCNKPKTMLMQAKDALAPGGVLMLALVLPYKPYVEVTADHKPEERLPIEGNLFEDQLTTFVKFMREEAGFELISWTRAPYLCEGDFAQAYYWLDDSVYVFRPIN